MEDVARPTPQRGRSGPVSGPVGRGVVGAVERWNDAVAWIGLGRLIASASAVVIVCLGAFWLVRSPRPPIEASLPQATTSIVGSGTVSATLPPPSTAPVTTEPQSDGPITVHVAGAVRSPGVYELRAGDRVSQAISAAGGATAAGRPDELNLAAVIVDGSRIHVPVEGEAVEIPVVVADSFADQPVAAGPIDVNRAGPVELETLPGVGPATAAAIVAERSRNGPFLNIDDLERVPGIGPGKLAALRDLVTV